MIAVIFENLPGQGQRSAYLDQAEKLRQILGASPGLISVERFESLSEPGKLLSLSFWEDETAVANWRQQPTHRQAQSAGRKAIFANYRLRVAHVLRDYGMTDRDQAPVDSRNTHE